MSIFRKEVRKQYFVTKYKKALDGSENKKVRRVRYYNDYFFFGLRVWSKFVKIRKARDQYGLENAPAIDQEQEGQPDA